MTGHGVAAIKAKGKRQKAKGKSTGGEQAVLLRTFAFCLLPFAFCLDHSHHAAILAISS
jgi:hypothetical protein